VIPELADAVVPSDEVVVVPPTVLPAVVLPIVVLPMHGTDGAMLRLGIAVNAPRSIVGEVRPDGVMVSIGLTPALPISVAPSGMLPPPGSRPAVPPGVESGEAVPVEDTAMEDPEMQPVEAIPAPSKVAAGEVELDWAIAAPPTPDNGLAAEVQGAGLKPPGSIPVAPSGIPVGAPEVAALSPLRGDVAPSADVLGLVCA
jgi:hypothetical protein